MQDFIIRLERTPLGSCAAPRVGIRMALDSDALKAQLDALGEAEIIRLIGTAVIKNLAVGNEPVLVENSLSLHTA